VSICKNILETIGNTPIVQIQKLAREVSSNIYVKLEYLSVGGSIKDRIATYIVDDAEKSGRLKPGGTIIEATSGNTGFGLAIVAAVRGYKTIFVMPDKMSQEKIQNLRAFGARVIITPTNVPPEDPRSYYSVAKRLVEETPNCCYSNQYHNPQNPLTHYEKTGPELWKQMDGKLDALVCGLGTGGTVTGIGKYLKEQNPKIKIVGADPIGSVYYEYFKTKKMGQAHAYKVEGIGEDFLPSTIDFKYIDDVVQVTDKESFQTTRQLLTEEGIFAGGSSGAAVCGAIKYAKTLKKPEEILVILPDSGDRYLSKVFNDDWMRENGYLDTKFEFGTARDILDIKSGPERIVTTAKNTKIIDVIRLMKEHGISQLPVVDKSGILGMVSEAKILQYLFDKSHKAEDVIEPLISDRFKQISFDESVQNIADTIRDNKTVVVFESGKIFGIITKIDLLSYYSRKMK